MDAIRQALILSVPLIVSGITHMAAVRANFVPWLRIPLHREWFGQNKTWRGVLVMPLATILGVKLTDSLWPGAFAGWDSIALGIMLGLAYVAFELPNSFIKRRLGIEPGKRPARHAFAFAFADQADSAIGCALVYWYALDLRVQTVLLLILIGPVVHLMVNYTLYLLSLRREPV
jgi:CDP-diacylglycerol--serine O-phosphatidyltransferase